MASETKVYLYYTPKKGTEQELGAYFDEVDANDAMNEHYEGLHESGETIRELRHFPRTWGQEEGELWLGHEKGSYRIVERRVKR